MDLPDGRRKRHDRATPMAGGLAAVPAGVAAFLLAGLFAGDWYFAMAAGLVGLSFGLGFLDDRAGLSARWRLAVSALAVLGVFSAMPEMALGELRFSFLAPERAIVLGPMMAVGFTVLVLVGLQNAVNMADGKNGLVTGLCLIWCGFLAVAAPGPVAAVALVLAAALVPVLAFNLTGRLFLGDAGSYGLAMAIGLLSIYAYTLSGPALPADVVALWFWIPVLDCLRLIAIRLLNGRSPLNGDRMHFHHVLYETMPWRYGLAVYLALVAMPGAAAIAAPDLAMSLALVSMLVYAAVLALSAPRRAQAQQKIS